MGKLKERKIIATLAAFVGEDKDAHPDTKAEKEFLIFHEDEIGSAFWLTEEHLQFILLVQNNEHMPEKLDFLTPTTLKVLEFFFVNSMNEFHEREIVRNANISKGSANKILRHLSSLSLLQRDKKGRMVFYRLNRGDPVVKHLKILSNLWALREFVERARENAKKIILFGSCAEGTDVKESDIDIFILTREKKPAMEAVSRFNQRNERKISPVILGSDEFTKMKREEKPLYERIDRGIVLWETT